MADQNLSAQTDEGKSAHWLPSSLFMDIIEELPADSPLREALITFKEGATAPKTLYLDHLVTLKKKEFHGILEELAHYKHLHAVAEIEKLVHKHRAKAASMRHAHAAKLLKQAKRAHVEVQHV